MTKKKKIIISVVSAAIVLVLIASLIIALVINNKKEKTPATVMTCSVNPQIQFVLNQKDEVMKVVALNNDGQALVMKVDFVGLDAEDAAEMFVKISTEAGYINPDTTGTAVNFDLSGDKKDYSKLQDKIKEQVNEYFDENGIIAGAVTKVVEDFKEAIKTLKPNALNLDGKSQEELMQHYLDITEMINGIAPERLETFYTEYNKAYNKYKQDKDYFDSEIQKLSDIITNYENQLKNLPDGALKQTTLEALNQARTNTMNAQQEIADAERLFNIECTSLINSAKTLSETIYENLKTEIEQKINATKTLLENRKTYFEAHRSEVETKIAEFRATLNA